MDLHLYHRTNSVGLKGILSSMSFQPSYCLEKADYLNINKNFAFAMVCFADLLDEELNDHMTCFRSSAYLRMKKDWAIRNGVNPVCYYNKRSPLAACIRTIINDCLIKYEANNIDEENKLNTPFFNGLNVFLGYMKQYKGRYWTSNDWSSETIFFKEREWRYIPLVQNREAYFLPEEEFLDETLRKERQKELIRNNYILQFTLDDIEKIGISDDRDMQWLNNEISSGKFPDNIQFKVEKIKFH